MTFQLVVQVANECVTNRVVAERYLVIVTPKKLKNAMEITAPIVVNAMIPL